MPTAAFLPLRKNNGVPDLSRARRSAEKKLPIQDDSPADSCTDGEIDEIFRPPPDSKDLFSDRRRIGVVGDLDREFESSLKKPFERKTFPSFQMGGAFDHPLGGIDRARNPDPDAGEPP